MLACQGIGLEKEFGGDVEAAAEAFDVVFVEVALAAEDFGDDARSAEDIGEVFLQEAVLVHEELEDFARLGAEERRFRTRDGGRKRR